MKYLKERSQFKYDISLPRSINTINSIFDENGYKLYLVGGAVRDTLDGSNPKDFDVATDATPSQVIDMFVGKFGIKNKKGQHQQLKNGWSISAQGKSFGVIVIFIPGEKEGVEIASFNTRHDGEIVLNDVSINDDAERRDITFNALYYDITNKKVIDLVGGVSDLESKKLRMVGDPNQRIMEDPLRIQRLFRFGCRYNSLMDDLTKKAIYKNKNLYRQPTPERPNGVSQERIIQEFKSSFHTIKDFTKYLDYINEFEMWEILFPGIGFVEFDTSKYKSTNKLSICLAQILINEDMDIFKSVMVNEWKFSRDVTNEVSILVELIRVEDPKKAVNLKLRQIRFNIPNKIIKEFTNIMGLKSDIINKFLEFDPTIDSIKIMDNNDMNHEKGKLVNPKQDGKKLGILISQKRLSNFNNL